MNHFLPANRIPWTFFLLILLALTCALVAPAAAATGGVGCDVNELISAVAFANASPGADTLELSTGCSYVLTAVNNTGDTYGANGLPVITDDLTLDGKNATITRAGDAAKFRFFQIQSGVKLTLNQLALSHGELKPDSATAGEYYGGAIYNLGTLVLTDCVVQDNWAHDKGGGIYNDGGTVEINDSTFSRNGRNPDLYSTSLGAAIHNKNGTMTVRAGEFIENRAAYGGGAIYSEGALDVSNSRFLENVVEPSGSQLGGGAIFNIGTLVVNTSTFEGNSAMAFGGALYISGTGTVSASTFAKNTVIGVHGLGGGGAIYGATAISNSTFDDNYAGTFAYGAAIHTGGTITNSTFTSNASIGPFPFVTGIYNAALKNSIIYDTACASVTNGGGNLRWPQSNFDCPGRWGHPKLGPLADNGGPTMTRALAPDSPAVNAARKANCPATDQRGVARPQGERCDIGAFELQPPTAANLLLPADNKKMTHERVNLRWEVGERVAFYHVLVRQDSPTGDKVVNLRVMPTNYKTPALEAGHWYYWRIKACSNVGCAQSEWRRFRVK